MSLILLSVMGWERITMRFPVKTTAILLLLGTAGAAARFPLTAHWKEGHRPEYRHAQITQGPIVAVVKATGSVQPVASISVGASPSVCGPIVHIDGDFTDSVKKGQLLAKIDPRLYEAAVARDRAVLATKKA